MTTLLIATRNAHKVQEINQILGPAFRCVALTNFPGAPAVVEDADTFAGNATKKAVSLADWLKARGNGPKPDFVLADDSGLEVDALDGAPGVHSARFAANDASSGNAPDAANNAKLLRLLEGKTVDQRTARFRCVLALQPMNNAGEMVLFDGVCEGKISIAAAGKGGFGYDPLFVPDGFTRSFAELGEDVKNKISHRARALEKLRQFLAQPRF
jgi:XTP/dITP diphosphohydrolase